MLLFFSSKFCSIKRKINFIFNLSNDIGINVKKSVLIQELEDRSIHFNI